MRAGRKIAHQQIVIQLCHLFDVYIQALIKAMKFYLRKKIVRARRNAIIRTSPSPDVGRNILTPK